MAIARAPTDLFISLDCDFMPTSNGHERMVKLLFHSNSTHHGRSFREALVENRTLFVLPAFEYSDRALNVQLSELPESSKEVAMLVSQGKMTQFKPKWHQRGHRNTNFGKWLSIARSAKPIEKDSLPSSYTVNYEHSFEPYVLGWRPNMPKFVPEFRGWGKNKLSWFLELHCAGYQFAVVTDSFIVHMNHPTTSQKHKNVDEGRNRPIWKQFTEELERKYPDCVAIHQYEWWDAFLDGLKLEKVGRLRRLIVLALVVVTLGILCGGRLCRSKSWVCLELAAREPIPWKHRSAN